MNKIQKVQKKYYGRVWSGFEQLDDVAKTLLDEYTSKTVARNTASLHVLEIQQETQAQMIF